MLSFQNCSHSYPSQLEPSINVKVVVVHVKVLNPVERVEQFKHSYGWCIEWAPWLWTNSQTGNRYWIHSFFILAGMMLAAAYSLFVHTIVPRNAWCDCVTVSSSHWWWCKQKVSISFLSLIFTHCLLIWFVMVVKHTPACTANDWLAPEQEAAVEGFCLYTGGEGKTINGLLICVASRSYMWNITKRVECFISSITNLSQVCCFAREFIQ